MTTPTSPRTTVPQPPVVPDPENDELSVQEVYEELYEFGAYTRSTYQPTAEQLARDKALQQYNRRNVYLPILIATFIAITLFVILFALAFGVNTPQSRLFIAGLSALVVILFAIPTTILMTLLPLGYLYWWFSRRQQRKLNPETGPMAYRSPIQAFLWRVESYLQRTQTQVERGSDATTRPLIKAHTFATYIEEFADGMWRNFFGSNDNDNK